MTYPTTVNYLVKTPIISIGPDASLREASVGMSRAEVGALPVMDGDRVLGIVSERDVVRALAEGSDADSCRVSEVMSRDPRYVTVADSVTSALDVMLTVGVRHLPVFDEGEPIGIVSIRDLAGAVVT